jgi:O-antigen/teichoic acid export membrane protein
VNNPPRGDLGGRKGILRLLLFVGMSEAAAKAGVVVATLIVARSLGAAEFGSWSFAIALTGVFAMLSDAGMTSAIQKRVAVGADDARVVIGNAISLRVVTALLAFGAMALVAINSGKSAEVVLLLLLLGVAATTTQLVLFIQGVFRALGCSQFDAATRIGHQILILTPVIVVATRGGSMIAFGIAFAAAACVTLVVTTALLRSRVASAPRFSAREWRVIAAEAWPFWLSGLLWIAYFRIDVLILSYVSTDHETGLYNMAYNGFQVLTLPASILALGLFPSFAQLHAHEGERFRLVRNRALRTAVFVALPVTVASALAAEFVIALVLGEGYAGSVPMFRVLALALVFVYGNYVMYQSLSAADRAPLVALVTGLGVALNVALNLLLVRSLAGMGAALATLGTEATLFVVLVACSRWSLGSVTTRDKPIPLPERALPKAA